MPKKAGSEIGKKRRGSFKSKIPEIIDDEYSAISQDLLKQLGYLFREYYFLTMFRKMYFPSKSLEECAQFIVDNEGENLQLFEAAIAVNYFEILLQSNSLHSNERTICTSFEMLMNAFVKFNLEYKQTDICIQVRFPDLMNRTTNLKICGSKNKNATLFFYSKSFEIQALVLFDNESNKFGTSYRKFFSKIVSTNKITYRFLRN